MGWRIGSECDINHIAAGSISSCTYHNALVGAIDLDATDVILSSRAADGEAGDVAVATNRVCLFTLVGGQVRHRNVVTIRDIRST